MQCMGNSGCLPQGKWAAIVWLYPAGFLFLFSPCVQCFRVCIPPAVKHTILQQMDMGCLTCAQIWVCVIHIYRCMKGGQAQTNIHKSWLEGTENCFSPCSARESKPRVFRFESRLANHWAMYPIDVRHLSPGLGKQTLGHPSHSNGNDCKTNV